VKYKVTAYRTRSLCKAYRIFEHYNTPMEFGPWKRLKTAKRKRAELNKDRVLVCGTAGGQTFDLGPAFRLVKIVEVAEEGKE
jgi:hypothetical protein